MKITNQPPETTKHAEPIDTSIKRKDVMRAIATFSAIMVLILAAALSQGLGRPVVLQWAMAAFAGLGVWSLLWSRRS